VLDHHKAWFEDHVRSFLTGHPQDDRHILLKKDHSLKVLAEAMDITACLDIPARLRDTVHLGALYHDVGRFTQYSRYKTFREDRSVNHGLLGCLVLRQTPALDCLDREQAGLVRAVVAVHNRREVPGRLPKDLDLAVRVVRDSDKLDIMRIMLAHFKPGAQKSDVVTLHLADEPGGFTPSIVEDIRAGRIGRYASMRYVNDFKLLLISWVFDLNFPASRRAFHNRGYAEELLGSLPERPELTGLKDRIYEALND